jgi:ketosteroid isomerase-like protein
MPRVIMAVIAGVAVLAVAAVLVYKFILGGSNSDEDRIRAVMQQEQAAYNNLDYNAYLQTLCAEQRPQQESQLRWVSQNKAANDMYGPIEFSLTNIKVAGDTATGNMSINGQKEPESRRTTVTAQFVREGGAWKDCSPSWSH